MCRPIVGGAWISVISCGVALADCGRSLGDVVMQ
jgi:hypothetical protein